MSEYRQPKLVGQRIPTNLGLTPQQHKLLWERSQASGMSYGEYVGALIERAAGVPNALDSKRGQEMIDFRTS